MLLSSGIITMNLGLTKSRSPEVLEAPCDILEHDFSKFSLIDLSFNYASIQWRNIHVSGVDKVQGSEVLVASMLFFGSVIFHAIYFIFSCKFSLINYFSFNYAS